ncbi:MAG: substrate-binding domain-containing protein [Oscillospiraceae bacterium]
MKRLAAIVLSGLLAITVLAGCGTTASQSTPVASSTGTSSSKAPESTFDTSKSIAVISREDGSGTRGAFVELVGILEEVDGQKVDMTTQGANIVNSTSVVVTTVVGDPYSIGYISLGSLDDSVKAFKIDGVEASAENINNGTYPIYRPFNIAVSKNAAEGTEDFIKFVLSTQGQEVVTENGYIALKDAQDYAASGASGKIVIAGSSSVSPLMEKLVEAYKVLNPDVQIEIQTSDSTTGMNNAIDGICDIGMASRNLKDAELEAGLEPVVIANDGIAVIGNLENSVNDLSKDSIGSIFKGDITTWAELA